jgi:hypothetical protein
MMTKWKYMTQQFSTEGLSVEAVVERRHAEMSLMGEYGWELVSANVYRSPDTGLDVVILFYKKPVSDNLTPASTGRR